MNMSSVAGRFEYANRSPNCTAKWGLIGSTKIFSIELGAFGIRANVVLPDAVDGPRIETVLEGHVKATCPSVEDSEVDFRQMLPIDHDMQQAS